MTRLLLSPESRDELEYLIEKTQQGDQPALCALLVKARGFLEHMMKRIWPGTGHRTHSDGDDLVQEALIAVYHAVDPAVTMLREKKTTSHRCSIRFRGTASFAAVLIACAAWSSNVWGREVRMEELEIRTAGVDVDNPDEIAFITAQLFATLESIRRGAFDFQVTMYGNGEDSRRVLYRVRGQMAFDYEGGRTRFDYHWEYDAERPPIERTPFQFVRTDEYTLFGGGGGGIARRPPEQMCRAAVCPFAIRATGITSYNSWMRKDFDTIRTSYSDLGMPECQRRGEGLVSLVWSGIGHLDTRWRKELVVDETRGCVPIRFQAWTSPPLDPESSLLLNSAAEITWIKEGADAQVPGIAEFTEPGAGEIGKIVVEFMWRSVGAELDERLFMPDGFDPPAGTKLVDFRLSPPVVERVFGNPDTVDGTLMPSARNRWLLALLGLLIPLSAYMAWRALRSERTGGAARANG